MSPWNISGSVGGGSAILHASWVAVSAGTVSTASPGVVHSFVAGGAVPHDALHQPHTPLVLVHQFEDGARLVQVDDEHHVTPLDGVMAAGAVIAGAAWLRRKRDGL